MLTVIPVRMTSKMTMVTFLMRILITKSKQPLKPLLMQKC